MKDKTVTRKVGCDDRMFMQSELILTVNPDNNIKSVRIEVETQAGFPLILRKYEVDELIQVLTELKELI